MKNSDLPANPTPYMDLVTGSGELHCDHVGLTRRETMAKDMDVSHVEFTSRESLEEFIGCKVDQSNIISIIESGAKATAKLKVMFADALLTELDKEGTE